MQSSEWKLRKCRQAGIEFFHYTVLCFLIFCFFAMQLQWESVPRTNWTPPSSRDGGGGVTAVASRRWRHACGGAQEVALWTDFKTPWLVSTMFFLPFCSLSCEIEQYRGFMCYLCVLNFVFHLAYWRYGLQKNSACYLFSGEIARIGVMVTKTVGIVHCRCLIVAIGCYS